MGERLTNRLGDVDIIPIVLHPLCPSSLVESSWPSESENIRSASSGPTFPPPSAAGSHGSLRRKGRCSVAARVVGLPAGQVSGVH